MKRIKKAAGKVLYLLSFVLAAIITSLIFNTLIYNINGVKNKGSKHSIKGESLYRDDKEIKLLGILHMNWNYMKVTNVIFNNGCIYLDENGMIVNSFQYNYAYSLRHLQEVARYELYDKYKTKEISLDDLDRFTSTYFSEVDYQERNKIFYNIIRHDKIKINEIKVKELKYQELQKMIKLIEERGVDKILSEENWFVDW